MDAAELRAMQAPIKERYKSDPSAAVITLKAKGSIDSEGIACKVETGRALAMAGGLERLDLSSGALFWARAPEALNKRTAPASMATRGEKRRMRKRKEKWE